MHKHALLYSREETFVTMNAYKCTFGGGVLHQGVKNRSKSMIEKLIDISILIDIIRY